MHYNIPKSTLGDRASGRTMPGSTIGRPPALDSKLESGIMRRDCIYADLEILALTEYSRELKL